MNPNPNFRSGIVMVLLSASAASVSAETDAQRAARFSAFFGAGKYARIVWQKEISADGFPSDEGTTATQIMKLDTKTGTIEVLVNNKSGFRAVAPVFTWDGNRVVYYNIIANQVCVIDWGGTNDRVVANGYGGAGRCWRSSDGKDYVLGNSNSVLYKINIDNTSDRTSVYNGKTHWASMSPDGNFVAAAFPDYPRVGIYKVATGSLNLLAGGNAGCWPTIARDNTHHVLHSDMSHQYIHIVDENGNGVGTDKKVPAALYNCNGQAPDGEYETERWTSDRDYVTMYSMYCFTSGPWVLRISDLKYEAINEQTTTAEANCDVYFYTGTASAASRPASVAGVRRTGDRGESPRFYDCRGRLAPGAHAARPGVYLVADRFHLRRFLTVVE